MNLAAKHRKLFEPGCKVEVYAGYAQDGVGLLSSGAIRHTSPMTSDGTNNTFSFTYREGDEYQTAKSSVQEANDKLDKERAHEVKVLGKKAAAKLPKIKKHSAMSFAKGSSAETIIRRVASDAGIKLTKVYLKKNHVYKKGYTVSGKPYLVSKRLPNSVVVRSLCVVAVCISMTCPKQWATKSTS